MNQHDLDNLAFLMALDGETAFREWFITQPPDDIVYALELLDTAMAEQPIDDVTQAAELLRRFTL